MELKKRKKKRRNLTISTVSTVDMTILVKQNTSRIMFLSLNKLKKQAYPFHHRSKQLRKYLLSTKPHQAGRYGTDCSSVNPAV